MRTYANQFPPRYAPPPALLHALEEAGWEDRSWGNDACPRWEKPARREWMPDPVVLGFCCGPPGLPARFALTLWTGDGHWIGIVHETSDVRAAVRLALAFGRP